MTTPHYDDSFALGKVASTQPDIRPATAIPVLAETTPKLGIQLDIHGKHFNDYIIKYCMGRQICEGYDAMLQRGLDNALANLTFYSNEIPAQGMQEKREYSIVEKIILPPALSPQQAIDQKKTYAVTVTARFGYCRVAQYNNTFTRIGPMNRLEETIKVFDIPIPIGSKYCHTNKFSPEEKIRLGIHRQLVQGVFIIEGMFKTGITHDQQAVNRPIVHRDTTENGNPVIRCTMTCVTKDGTVPVKLFYLPSPILAPGAKYTPDSKGPEYRSVMIHLPCFGNIDNNSGTNKKSKKRSISIYSLYNMITTGLKGTMPTLDERIARYVTAEEHDRVFEELKYSEFHYIKEARNVLDSSNDDWRIVSKRAVIVNDLFPHINDFSEIFFAPDTDYDTVIPVGASDAALRFVDHKLETLAMMVAQIIRAVIGTRQFDQRNFLKNKKIQTIGKSAEQLINGALRRVQYETMKTISDKDTGVLQDARFSNYYSKIVPIMADVNNKTIKTSFTSKWGNKLRLASSNKANIETPNTTIYLALLYYVMRIVKPIFEKNPSREIREGQPGNTGFIGFYQTPERAKAGLVLALAMMCRVSNDTSFVETYSRIKGEKIFRQGYQSGDVSLYVAGRFVGFCQVQQAMAALLRLKRYGMIDRTTGIVGSFDELNPTIRTSNDRCIYVSTEGGRPYRPLFVVDSLSRELVIDILDKGRSPSDTPATITNQLAQQVQILKSKYKTVTLWDVPIDELMTVGAVEYIDAYEQSERCIIAPSYDSFLYARITVDRLQLELGMLNQLDTRRHIQENEFDVKDWTQDIDSQMIAASPAFALISQYLSEPDVAVSSPAQINEAQRLIAIVDGAVANINAYRSIVSTTDQRLQIARRTFVFNYCEIDPVSLFSDMESVISHIDAMMGPRITYGLKMQEANLKIDHDAIYRQFYSGTQYTFHVNPPLIQTQTFPVYGMDGMNSNSYNVNAALMPWEGLNQEDALILNETSVQINDLFTVKKIFTFEFIEQVEDKTFKNIGWSPLPDGVQADRYHAIIKPYRSRDGIYDPTSQDNKEKDRQGLPLIGTRVDIGDCIIRGFRNTDRGIVDASIYIGNGESGIVNSIQIQGSAGSRRVSVNVIQIRKVQPGDKINTPQGQKTTISRILKPWELPHDEFGRVPDIITNPLQQPGRMTPGMMFEMMACRLATRTGNVINATAFRTFNYEKLKMAMQSFTGRREIMTRFYTPEGEEIKGTIFAGIIRGMASRHRVEDKHQVRGFGTRRPDNFQPGGGRAVGGGLRYGEGESFTTLAHGAAGVLYERLIQSSDGQEIVFCIHCKEQSIVKFGNKVECLTRGCTNQGHSNDFVKIVIPGIYKYVKVLLALTGTDLHIVDFKRIN